MPAVSKADSLRVLGERIRERRTSMRLSGAELALRAGFDRSYINSLENARRGSYPKRETIEAIARALRCAPEQLTGAQPFDVPQSPYDRAPAVRRFVDALVDLSPAERELATELLSMFRDALAATAADSTLPVGATPGDAQRLVAAVSRLDEKSQRRFFEELASTDMFSSLKLKK